MSLTLEASAYDRDPYQRSQDSHGVWDGHYLWARLIQRGRLKGLQQPQCRKPSDLRTWMEGNQSYLLTDETRRAEGKIAQKTYNK